MRAACPFASPIEKISAAGEALAVLERGGDAPAEGDLAEVDVPVKNKKRSVDINTSLPQIKKKKKNTKPTRRATFVHIYLLGPFFCSPDIEGVLSL